MIYTVGHSTHPLDDFVSLLRGAGVAALADVRRYPGSRRQPHFNREALAEALPAAGIAYAHFERLGGRRDVVPRSPNRGWDNEAFVAYADHMATPDFADTHSSSRCHAAASDGDQEYIRAEAIMGRAGSGC